MTPPPLSPEEQKKRDRLIGAGAVVLLVSFVCCLVSAPLGCRAAFGGGEGDPCQTHTDCKPWLQCFREIGTSVTTCGTE